MIILRQKVFFEFGITTDDIKKHATANNMSVNEAYGALKNQRATQGIGQEAFKAGDKSLFRADTIKATKNSTGVVGQSAGGQFGYNNYKASATSASAANTKFNNAYNMGKSSGFQAGIQAGNPSGVPLGKSRGFQAGVKVGNAWNNMGTMGRVGTAAAAIGATALVAKGVKNMLDKKKEDK